MWECVELFDVKYFFYAGLTQKEYKNKSGKSQVLQLNDGDLRDGRGG